MVSVFKTNVKSSQEADLILNRLSDQYPDFRINFDLEDCDNILRIEGTGIKVINIVLGLEELGYYCEELPF